MSTSTIFSSLHSDITKRVSVSGIVISSLMLLAGILLFVLTFELHVHSSTISMALMVVGTGLFLWGVFRLFWKSRQLVYLPTGSVVKERSMFFDVKDLESLTQMVNATDFSAGMDVQRCVSGNVRMDLLLSADHQFIAVQLFQFVPYNYQPVTQVRYFTGNDAAVFATFVEKNSKH